MAYVDGYVVPVPKKNLKAYLAMARTVGKVWKDYGALEYVECVADDVKPGKWTSFPRSVKLKKDETVIFAYAAFKNRKHRDAVMGKSVKDPRSAKIMASKMPFDGKRMIFGGFKVQISL
jgi:uncharacterized protein YbaA (DUF1428 family)